MVFSLKRSTAEVFAVPFSVLSQNNVNCFKTGAYYFVEKKFSSHAHKTVIWYFLGILIKILDKNLHLV